MSDTDDSFSKIDGTLLSDPIETCDGLISDIVRSHQGTHSEAELLEKAYELYKEVRINSIGAFESRFGASALYDALKSFLRCIGEECGYEHHMHYRTNYGRKEVSDAINIGMYWFKLYAAVVLDIQPEIKYEWAVSDFKEHRDEQVSHPESIQMPGKGPDPIFVSSVVPLWYVLEDVLRYWRSILDKDLDRRDEREQILRGEIAPDGGLATYRYGFINNINHRKGRKDEGYITGYQNGENGKNSRFVVGDADFFPSVGDIVRFNAEQDTNYDGEPYSTLSVRDTVTLVE